MDPMFTHTQYSSKDFSNTRHTYINLINDNESEIFFIAPPASVSA